MISKGFNKKEVSQKNNEHVRQAMLKHADQQFRNNFRSLKRPEKKDPPIEMFMNSNNFFQVSKSKMKPSASD